MGHPRERLNGLAVVSLLLSILTTHAVSIRIRDRALDHTAVNTNPSGQFLRERVVVSSSPSVVPSSTQAPANLLLEYYTRTQVNPKTVIVSSSSPPPGVYTSLVDSYEDEDGSAPESSYESDISSGESTTTVRAIPAAFRRNFGRGGGVGEDSATTPEAVTEHYLPPKPVRKKSKTKSRRRKVKRPQQDQPVALAVVTEQDEVPGVKGLSQEQPGAAQQQDLGTAGNPTKEEEGEKNLAFEIGSDDGKYALINNFFNDTGLIQPGIVSYEPSEDFAQDNDRTLGKLEENEIWLSDGHLLVLKGGEYDATNKEKWPPIDNLQRKGQPPLRIPLDSDNPPPFPVFLNKTGPPVFLVEPPPFLPYPPPGFFGNDTDFDPSRFPPPGMIPLNPNGTLPFPPGGPLGLFPGGPPDGVYGGGYGQGGNGTLPPPPPFYPFPPPRNGSLPPGPFPFPPPGFNGTKNGQFPPNFLPPPPGFNPNFNGSFPPGPFPPPPFPQLVLNPADNETDDPSVFLPPPYDFDYYEDNTTLVPPGPFAPGLVVPPPRDFYSVFNRTSSRPPTRITTTRRPFPPYFPPAATPIPDSFTTTTYVPKKQRPNGKKPKFPMTNPPDDSLEELYPHTTPVPVVVYTTTKKRKQRPKKPFFPLEGPGDYNQGKSISSEEIVTLPPSSRRPTIIFPEYGSPIETTPRGPHFVTAIYTTTTAPIRLASKTTRVTTTTTPRTTTTTTPRNSFVYVQGRLTTLEELAALGQLEEVDPNQPSTPRPPFDSQGYPTRVVDDDDGTPVIYEITREPTKLNRKPTEPPLKAYYPGTPKYESTYDPYDGTGKIKNSNVQFTSPAPVILQQRVPSRARPLRPTVLYQQPTPVYPSQAAPKAPATTVSSGQGGYYAQPYYNNAPIQSIGPSYITTGGGENDPQSQITFIPHQQHHQQYQQRRPNQDNYDNQPKYQQQNYYQTSQLGQQQPQSGFRPSFAPPQKNPATPTRSKTRLLFPTTATTAVRQPQSFVAQQNGGASLDNGGSFGNQQQHVQAEKPRKLHTFSPNGYYSPITNYYQPANVAGQSFFPGFFGALQAAGLNVANPQSNNNNNNANGYFQTNPLSITNFNANPTISSVIRPSSFGIQYNPYLQQQQQPQQLAQHPQRQQLQSQPNYQTNYNNAQLNQYAHPLYDDINVNYREPLPQYNTESESISTRGALKAGPSASPSDRVSASSTPGTFYSFQRGGPGGFSYKIRL